MRVPFWSIFEDSKNRRFFDVALDRRKIDKNRALGGHGPKTALRTVAGWDTLVTGAPRAAAIIKDIQGIKDQGLPKETLTRHGPLARRIL